MSFVSCSWLNTSQPTSMNKIIFTNDRLFMSLVGPGGSGETRLKFPMLASPTTFYPKLQNFYHFYKEYQPLFKEMAENWNIEFVPCLDFEMIRKLVNCLLVSDDSCEIYQQKEFLKIAVAGRQKDSLDFRETVCFIRASGRVLLTSIQHILSYWNLRVTLSKFITLVDN